METLARLGIILCTFIGASTIVIAEPLVASVPPLRLLGIRFIIASLLLAMTVPRKIFPLVGKALKGGIIAGVGFGLGSALLYLALPHVRAGKVTFLIALEVVIVPAILALLYKHTLAPSERLALIPAVLGLWLISGDAQGVISLWEFVALASAFAYSMYTISLSQGAYPGTIMSRTFISCLVIGALTLLVSFFLESDAPAVWTAPTLVSLAYLVLVGTVARFLVQAWAQQSVSASFTALTFAAEPVFAIALSAIFLGERFTLTQSFGAMSILCAVGLVHYRTIIPTRTDS
jgi:drug/metabolite transporter (DMT)-like permease